MPRVDKRFWASTRGKLLTLLRGGTTTVAELAAELGITKTAVRVQLTALDRDGLVRAAGTRRGPRKPTITYALTSEAEYLFPKEYGPVLRNMLDILKERLTAEQLDDVMRATGRRLARTLRLPDANGKRDDRVQRAVTVLRDLGGCCERAEVNGTFHLSCSVCPLAIAAEGHPEVCRLIEALLTEVVASPVRLQCQTNPPRCRFEMKRKAAAS
jgi:predicted ArsR family transcriptional regulator